MAFRRSSESGREAVIWLATWAVLVLGAAASLVVILGMAEDKNSTLWRAAGVFAVVTVLLWLLRPTDQTNAYRLQYSTPHCRVWWKPWTWSAPKAERQSISMKDMKKAAASRRPAPIAAAGPPTADRVREIAANTNAWLPAGTPPQSRNADRSGAASSKQTPARKNPKTNPNQ